MTERWLPIPGYEHYEVSSEGRVRSLARLIHTRNGHTRWYDGQIRRRYPIPKPVVSPLVHFSARIRAASWPLTTAFTVAGTTACRPVRWARRRR